MFKEGQDMGRVITLEDVEVQRKVKGERKEGRRKWEGVVKKDQNME